jgi:hypothetical protein
MSKVNCLKNKYIIKKSKQCLLATFAPLIKAINVINYILFSKETLNIIY